MAILFPFLLKYVRSYHRTFLFFKQYFALGGYELDWRWKGKNENLEIEYILDTIFFLLFLTGFTVFLSQL